MALAKKSRLNCNTTRFYNDPASPRYIKKIWEADVANHAKEQMEELERSTAAAEAAAAGSPEEKRFKACGFEVACSGQWQ